MTFKQNWIFVAAAAVALAALATGCRTSKQTAPAKPSTAVVYVDETNYRQEVLAAKLPVFIDFYATWCGPCKALAPLVDEAAVRYAGKIKFVKVDVDKSIRLEGLAGITAMPTLDFFSPENKTGLSLCAALDRKALESFLTTGLAFLSDHSNAVAAPKSYSDAEGISQPINTFDTARLSADPDSKLGHIGILFIGSDPNYIGLMLKLDKAKKQLPEHEKQLKLAQYQMDHPGDLVFYVLEVGPHSPAFKAGLRPQDTFTEIDGVSVKGMTESEVSGLLNGPVGTTVHIKVLRGWRHKEFTIVRVRPKNSK